MRLFVVCERDVIRGYWHVCAMDIAVKSLHTLMPPKQAALAWRKNVYGVCSIYQCSYARLYITRTLIAECEARKAVHQGKSSTAVTRDH